MKYKIRRLINTSKSVRNAPQSEHWYELSSAAGSISTFVPGILATSADGSTVSSTSLSVASSEDSEEPSPSKSLSSSLESSELSDANGSSDPLPSSSSSSSLVFFF